MSISFSLSLSLSRQAEKWDEVRTILKLKCGRLFAMGEAQNPVVQFAKGADEPELFELAEELGTALQLCDQFTCASSHAPERLGEFGGMFIF